MKSSNACFLWPNARQPPSPSPPPALLPPDLSNLAVLGTAKNLNNGPEVTFADGRKGTVTLVQDKAFGLHEIHLVSGHRRGCLGVHGGGAGGGAEGGAGGGAGQAV